VAEGSNTAREVLTGGLVGKAAAKGQKSEAKETEQVTEKQRNRVLKQNTSQLKGYIWL